MLPYDDRGRCTGCSACVHVCPVQCIAMQPDSEGFLYPRVDEDVCIGCGACRRVCLTVRLPALCEPPSRPIAYAVRHRAPSVLESSSSGGVFTALAEHALSLGGVIYGAAFDADLRVGHVRVTERAGFERCRGSKYSQSDMGSILCLVRSDLSSGRFVLFTGTPCQVAGLRNYLGNVETDNLLLCDFVCHGVPSPVLFGEFIRFLEHLSGRRVVDYHHRAKDEGWSHKEKALFEGGRSWFDTPAVELWKLLFYSDLALRPACYTCQFARLDRYSDITLADFWGIERIAPALHDPRGVSLVLANTLQGARAIASILDDVECAEVDAEAATQAQPMLRTPVALPGNRQEFWADHATYGFEATCERYGFYTRRLRIKGALKSAMRAVGLYRWVSRVRVRARARRRPLESV